MDIPCSCLSPGPKVVTTSYPLQGVDRWMRSMLHRAKNSGLCDWVEFFNRRSWRWSILLSSVWSYTDSRDFSRPGNPAIWGTLTHVDLWARYLLAGELMLASQVPLLQPTSNLQLPKYFPKP